MPDLFSLQGVQNDGAQPPKSRIHREEERAPFAPGGGFIQRPERGGVLDSERPRAAAYEGGQVGGAVQRDADVVRQRTRVESAAAFHVQDEVRRRPFDQLKGVHLDRARGAFDFDPLACQLVEPPALPLKGAVHGRDLLDGTAETIEDGCDLRSRNGRRVACDCGLPGRVIGVCGHSKAHGHGVGLGAEERCVGEARGLAQANGQHAGRAGVQGAAVPDLAAAGDAFDGAHHTGGGFARFLVDVQEAVGDWRSGGARHCPVGLSRSSESAADTRSMKASMSAAAARVRSDRKTSRGRRRR